MPGIDPDAVAAIRRFNRFHTRWVGALGGSLHGTGFALTEARVLYELAQRDGWLARDLARDLELDPAYLSRILKRFAEHGWLVRERSLQDGRALRLVLTPAGRSAFAPLENGSRKQAETILQQLAPAERCRLVDALGQAQALLSGAADPSPAVAIRDHRPGDMGWVLSSQGRFYAQQFGWNSEFEVLVAEIVGNFLRDFRPGLERCLIAELAGTPVGSSFVMRQDDQTAKLRLVFVEPEAHGLGLGKRLVAEAIGFARTAGYARMVLWTNDILHAARAIYVAQGFRLVAEERHHSFGQDLVGQNWELDL